MTVPIPLTSSQPDDSTWREWVELSQSRTTRAALTWSFTIDDIRQFVRYTRRIMTAHYDQLWDEIGRRPSDGESEQIDVFLSEVGGLMPGDQDYMLLSSAVRDAVTAYEVYLGDALREAMRAHRIQLDLGARLPGWAEIEPMYTMLRLKPRPAAVNRVIRLRNVLAHARGELRTGADRNAFAGPDDGFPAFVAHLDEDKVLACLQTLKDQVRRLDPVLFAHAYGSERVPKWLEYAVSSEGSAIPAGSEAPEAI